MGTLFDKMVDRYQDPAAMIKKAQAAGMERAEQVIAEKATDKPSFNEEGSLQDKIASMIDSIDESVKRDADPDDIQPESVQVADEDAAVKIAELIATDKAVESIPVKAKVEPKAAAVVKTAEAKVPAISGFEDAYDNMDFAKLAEEPIAFDKVGSTGGMIAAGLAGAGVAGGATFLGMKNKQDKMMGSFGKYVQLDHQRDKYNMQRAYMFGRKSVLAKATPEGGTV